jgi:xanthine/uracil permease
MTEHGTNKINKAGYAKSSRNYGGILWGLVLGVFVVGAYVLESSPSEFRNTSKLGLAFGVLVFVALGAVFGEKFMEKLGEWLKWF